MKPQHRLAHARLLRGLALASLLATNLLDALASSPKEVVRCTDAPRNTWIPVPKIREVFGEKNYTLVKFKISRANCYEFYAVAKDNSIVEAYYDPVTGNLVRHTRVTIPPQAGIEPPTQQSIANK